MKKFTFQIPAVEHLPAEEREEVVKRCLAAPEMQRFRRFAAIMCGASGLFSCAFFVVAMLRWKWSFPVAAVAFFGVAIGSLIIALAVKVGGEIWLLHRLARIEVGKK